MWHDAVPSAPRMSNLNMNYGKIRPFCGLTDTGHVVDLITSSISCCLASRREACRMSGQRRFLECIPPNMFLRMTCTRPSAPAGGFVEEDVPWTFSSA